MGKLFVTYLTLFLLTVAFATELHSAENSYVFRAVPGEVENQTVRKILKDSKGYVWFGSDNKVFRFDGVHSVCYCIPLSTPDVVVPVNDLAETSDGEIIIATSDGVYKTSGSGTGKLTMEEYFKGRKGAVSKLAVMPSGTVLLASPKGLWAYKPRGGGLSKILFDKNPLAPANIPTAIGVSANGAIAVTSEGNIFRIDDRLGVRPLKNTGIKDLSANAVAEVRNKAYVASGRDGLWVLDLFSHNFTKVEGIDANVVTSLASSGDSLLFVGTDGMGTYLINPKDNSIAGHIHHNPEINNSIQTNQIYSLLADNEGRLWTGHYQSGVDYSMASDCHFLLHHYTSTSMAVRTINITSDGRIITGTREGILILTPDMSKVETAVKRPALRSDMVISAEVVGDTLLIGTYGGGLSAFNLTKSSAIPSSGLLPSSLDTSHIFSITREPATGNIWFGTSSGLFRHSKKGLAHFTSENSPLPKGNVYTVFFDSQGKGWIGTEEGLAIWEPDMKRILTDCFPKDFISDAKIRQIYEGRDHTLYFVLENGNVAVSDLTMQEFSRPEIFRKRNYVVKALIEDDFGKIWLATNQGLTLWDKKNKIIRFGKDNGVPSSPFIHCIPAKTDNKLLFGNSSGLLEANPDIQDLGDDAATIRPSVAITDAPITYIDKVDSEDNGKTFTIRFDEYAKSVTLKFSPLDYISPENSKYEYSVNGGEWLPVSASYAITINDPGYGTNIVKVRLSGDSESETIIRLIMPKRILIWLWIAIAVVTAAAILSYLYLKRRHRMIASEETDGEVADEPITENGDKNQSDGSNTSRQKYATVAMTKEETRRIMNCVDELMRRKEYTNQNLKISDIAAVAEVTPHRMSYFFSQHLNIGFYDYINKFRIEEFKRLVAEGADQSLTLTGLSAKAGFSSRSSFFRAFRKLEGITPGDYLKMRHKD